jgi:ribosomal protein S12 methylthiotransferase accessory factor
MSERGKSHEAAIFPAVVGYLGNETDEGVLPRGEADPRLISFRGREFRSSKVLRSGTHRARDPAKTFQEIKPYLAAAGVTRIADVTRLDRVGVPTTLALRPNAETIACSSGKGITLDQANVSGAMEAFELHAAETADVASFRASYKETSKLFEVPAVDSSPLTAWSLFNVSVPLYCHVAWDIVRQVEVAVPLSLVGMSRGRGYMQTSGWFNVSSNGLGAGNSFLEAIAAGLYEVIERDAIACRYYVGARTGVPFPVLTDDLLHSFPLVSGVMTECDRAGVRMLVEDCTVDSIGSDVLRDRSRRGRSGSMCGLRFGCPPRPRDRGSPRRNRSSSGSAEFHRRITR